MINKLQINQKQVEIQQKRQNNQQLQEIQQKHQNNLEPQQIQQKLNSSSINQRISASVDFNTILRDVENRNEIKISSHAIDRLKERKIELNSKDMENLNNAVRIIRNKGGKEALILYNNVAFITSISNNTVITAVDKDNMKENVFTNIDSAIIL